MSLYFNSLLADQHRAELARVAANWRRRREAKRAAAASRAIAVRQAEGAQQVPVAVYCHRAAGRSMRSAA